jgi:hypothetical protein
MVTISSLKKRIDSLNISEQSMYAIDETRDKIILKQQMQMMHGLDSKGSKIGRYGSVKYAAAKFANNPLAGEGYVDLMLTKDFYNDQFVDVRTDTFVIDSGDEKTNKLIKKYGEDIFGLSKDYKKEYVQEDLHPVLLKNIRKAIKL